jgi:hypothetical protein
LRCKHDLARYFRCCHLQNPDQHHQQQQHRHQGSHCDQQRRPISSLPRSCHPYSSGSYRQEKQQHMPTQNHGVHRVYASKQYRQQQWWQCQWHRSYHSHRQQHQLQLWLSVPTARKASTQVSVMPAAHTRRYPTVTPPVTQPHRNLHKAPHRPSPAGMPDDQEAVKGPGAAADDVGVDGVHEAVSGGSWTSMPNLLSLFRVAVAPVLVHWVLQEQWDPAVVLLAVAGVSNLVTTGDHGVIFLPLSHIVITPRGNTCRCLCRRPWVG